MAGVENSPFVVYNWMKFSTIICLAVPMLVHFIFELIQYRQLLMKKAFYIVNYIPALLFFVYPYIHDFFLGDARIIKKWQYTYYVYEKDPLIFILFYTLVFVLSFGAFVFLFINIFKRKDRRIRKQLLIIACGFCIPNSIHLLDTFLSAFGYQKIANTLSPHILVLVLFIGYAMWKYKLFVLDTAVAADRIISVMQEGLLLLNSDGIIIETNPAFLNIFKLHNIELRHQHINILCKKGFLEKSVVSKIEAGSQFENYIICFSINDTIRHIAFSATIIFDSSKKKAGTVCVFRDISQLIDHTMELDYIHSRMNDILPIIQNVANGVYYTKCITTDKKDIFDTLASGINMMLEEIQASIKRLKTQKNWYETTLSSIGDGVIATDMESRIQFMNKPALDLTGWEKSEVSKIDIRHVFNIENEKTGEAVENPLLKVLRDGVVVGLANHTVIRTKTGKKIPIDDSGAPIKDMEGNIIGAVIVFRDISERSKLENEHEKMETIINNSIDFIGMATPEGKGLFINSAGFAMTGYSEKEFQTGMTISDFQPDLSPEIFNTILTKGQWQGESYIVHKNGTKIPVSQIIIAIRDKNGNVESISTIARDVSELKVSQKKLDEANTQLVYADRLAAIGKLAAGVAHEINNPLSYIKCNFDSLKTFVLQMKKKCHIFQSEEGKELMNEKDEEINNTFLFNEIDNLLAENKEGIDRIAKIVKSLREFALTNPKNEFALYNVNAGLQNSMVVANNEIKYTAIIDTDFGDIPSINCNGGELNQVFLNILINASHAIKERYGNRMEGRIKIKTFQLNNCVYCEISDNGTGIPTEHISKIFDPFFTTKAPGKGTGLGLNISYDIIVNKHHGELLVESTVGEGAKFIIKIPLSDDGDTQNVDLTKTEL